MAGTGGLGQRSRRDDADFRREKEALQAFGVELSDDHLDGYIYKPDCLKAQIEEQPKPWEVPLSQQIDNLLGPSTAMICQGPESWTNEEFLFEIREGIAYCTLNRPNANNAMNDGISAGLHDAIRILRQRTDIRIAVLTGAGKMFCAGGDPKSFQAAQATAGLIEAGGENAPEGLDSTLISTYSSALEEQESKRSREADAAKLARDMYDWATLPQFTIALMNGSAMGNGVGLVCACDTAIAVKAAHLTLSEVKLGVIPAVIAPHVIRTVGAANAKKLFVTAENCTMQQAKAYGLVQRIVNDTSDFPEVVKDMAQRVKLCAPEALATTKKCILNCLNQPLSQSLIDYTAQEYVRSRKGEECEQGMKAVTARTRPSWVSATIDVRDH